MATLTSVSCPSPSSCVAIGTFSDRSGNQRSLIAIWSRGRWRPTLANTLAGFAAEAGGTVTLQAISCARQDRCTAVGSATGHYLGAESEAVVAAGSPAR